MRILRIREARAKTGDSNSNFYNKVSAGLLPPPIKLSARSSACLESELDAVLAARAAGAGDDEIRILVKDLVARRSAEAARLRSIALGEAA